MFASLERESRAPVAGRRDFLAGSLGIGSAALAWLLARGPAASALRAGESALDGKPHHRPRALRVIQVFSCGGVSHLDTFQHKPALARHHGQELTGRENTGFFGQQGRIMRSPFAFARHGECGAWVSELFPHLAGVVDRLTFIHSMVAKSNNHTPATFQMNSGFTMNGFPCMGSWISYGLGSVQENLPTFVVLPDPRGLPAGGSINWTAGFLPATHQGVAFRTTAGTEPVANLRTPASVSPAARRASLDALRTLDGAYAARDPVTTELAARVRSYELAARLQLHVPEAVDIDGESEATRRLYGLDRDECAGFGRNCLLARRLVERGVRFVQLFHGGAFGSPRINWDAHESVVENHRKMAPSLDRPLAGLIRDLEARGLLEDTLVIWATEFGRGPVTQGIGKPGRDHHPDAFTCFLAGGGVRPGVAWGASDEIGYSTVESPVTVHDFHATILHLIGIDHEALTFYHNGVERRLTDVHGSVVRGLLL